MRVADLDVDSDHQRVAKLTMDEEATRNAGIYSYVLDGNEHHLNIRAFNEAVKQAAYERQKGIRLNCPKEKQ